MRGATPNDYQHRRWPTTVEVRNSSSLTINEAKALRAMLNEAIKLAEGERSSDA